jgi:nucleoid-associated protein YgaU
MKKIWFILIAAIVVLAASCATPAAASKDPAGAPAAAAVTGGSGGEYTQERADADFERAYDTYRSKIILDGAKKYRVVRGDTLSKIALANYGAPNNYGYFFPLIMMASPEAGVGDPELIEPGMELTIPDLQKNLNNAEARAAIKTFLLDIAKIYDNINKAHSALTRANLVALSNSL